MDFDKLAQAINEQIPIMLEELKKADPPDGIFDIVLRSTAISEDLEITTTVTTNVELCQRTDGSWEPEAMSTWRKVVRPADSKPVPAKVSYMFGIGDRVKLSDAAKMVTRGLEVQTIYGECEEGWIVALEGDNGAGVPLYTVCFELDHTIERDCMTKHVVLAETHLTECDR